MTSHSFAPANAMTQPSRVDVPVIISGAGPVGLTLSSLLSRQGVRHLVLEKRDRINTLPRARGINVRSVEILTQLDLSEELRRGGLPPLWTRQFVYTETMSGELVGVMPGNMGPGMTDAYSPCNYCVAAQDRLDPILYAKAKSFDTARILFNREVTGYEDEGDSVVATVRLRDGPGDGETQRIRAQYLIAADGGGKGSLRGMAGIATAYEETYRSFVSAHFHADLSRFTRGREGALIWTLKPGLVGVFHPLDGDTAWAVQIQYDPSREHPETWSTEVVLQRIRAMLGAADGDAVDIQIHKFYTFTLTASVADQLRKGRLLLAGDAAHKTLPHGGWGLNTGIHTAHNLAWKLAAVLRGEAPDALLETYNSERREAALRNCEFGKVNTRHIEQMMRALRESADLEQRRKIVDGSRQYGNWTGLDMGIHYEGSQGAGAFVPDSIAAPEVADPVIDYVPHAKPGWRAPHFWARTVPEGYRISVISLFDRDFVLLVGADGDEWLRAARDVSQTRDPKIKAYRVGPDADLIPESVDFTRLYGVSSSGAVLMRPDGHVAFRAQTRPGDCAAALNEALDTVLCRGH